MRKILPILLILLGIGGGGAAGLMLRPQPEEVAAINPCGDGTQVAHEEKEAEEVQPEDREYVKMNNQFVVPVVAEGRVEALVVMSLSVEVAAGTREAVFTREPKLRDAFLQVFFDHANLGGFTGTFTSSRNLEVLRRALRETAQSHFGDLVQDVLITDIARQDV